jgi:ABC-type branched-subunit amino acid transport system substrate-binding protein
MVLLMMILCVLNNHGLKYQQRYNQTKNLEIQSTTTANKVSNIVNQIDFSKEDFDLPPVDFEDVIVSNKTVVIEGNIVSVYN